MTSIERSPVSEFMVSTPSYYDRGLSEIYKEIAYKSNLILVGPKGVGKTLSVLSYCASTETPAVIMDCCEDTRRSHLVGQYIQKDSDTPFLLGPLPTAIDIANEYGRCVLVLEEINALTPHIQKILNPLTDFRKRVDVPEAQKTYRLNPEAKLWVFGTMNFTSYGGVYDLNEDLKSRFRIGTIDYPSTKDELSILISLLGAEQEPLLRKLITLASETRTASMSYALSTRDLAQIAEDTSLVGIAKALWLTMGKFDIGDHAVLKERSKSVGLLK